MPSSKTSDDAASDPGELVVNCEHLMEYVDSEREGGNAAFKKRDYSEALRAWQRGLDALAQCEGRPMKRADVPIVLKARTTLHSNKGQALIAMQFWRRAIKELSTAIEIDPSNAKAIWRRHKSHEALKNWKEAQADLEALLQPELQAAAGPLLAAADLGKEQLATLRASLQEKRDAADKEAEETFEDRVEWAAHKGIEELRERFEEITKKYGLHGNKELAAELSEMFMRPEGVTASFVAAVYQLEEDDAQVMLEWTKKACAMRDELGYQTMDQLV